MYIVFSSQQPGPFVYYQHVLVDVARHLHSSSLHYSCICVCVCACPDEDLSGYSCLRRCPYGGTVAFTANVGSNELKKKLKNPELDF